MTDNARPTIMIIEDDAMLANMFTRLFEVNGLSVISAYDGQDAIEKSKILQPPTIILLDLMMPRIDGFEVMSVLKKDEKWKIVPIVVFSNLGDEPDMERAIKMGAEEYMIKSQFSPKEVVVRISEIIAKHNATK